METSPAANTCTPDIVLRKGSREGEQAGRREGRWEEWNRKGA
jgi:hypothetical protein